MYSTGYAQTADCGSIQHLTDEQRTVTYSFVRSIHLLSRDSRARVHILGGRAHAHTRLGGVRVLLLAPCSAPSGYKRKTARSPGHTVRKHAR